MIPQTFPSTLNEFTGQRQMVALFLGSVAGLQRWVDYIPVGFGTGTTLIENSYDNNGFVAIQEITSAIGLIPFVDYVPVFFDATATDTWQASDAGFIPYGVSGVFSPPSLDISFTRNDTLDPRITFTRASSATRTNSQGLIEGVSSNTARFDYDPVTLAPKGLLIEEQRTNLLTYSADLDNAAWTKTLSSITANTIVAPDGTLTGDKLVEDTTATNTHFATPASASFVSGTAYTISFFAKSDGSGRRIQALFPNTAFSLSTRVNFNVDTQTVTPGVNATGTINAVGNGWYRCAATMTATATASATIPFVLATTDASSFAAATYTGNGYSGIYIWGAQVEAGAFPTSYIPTTTAQVTRAADSASMTGVNFSSWYRQDEGTLFVTSETKSNASFIRIAAISFGTSSANEIHISESLSIARGFIVQPSGTISFTGASWNGFGSAALAYKTSDSAFSFNGSLLSNSSAIPSAVRNTLSIGARATGESVLNGTIKKLAFYPQRLSNTELQGLTS
jgi:hypothetical protein